MPFANNNGVKIHYEVEGQGPPLMLVHGGGGSMENWRQNGYAQELTKDYHIIRIDVRGCGASDKPHDSSAYAFQLLVGDLVEVLDELNIEKASCFGYSMGGQIAFHIPLYAPQRFGSLIIGGAHYPLTAKGYSDYITMFEIQQRLEDAIREAPENPMEFYVAAQEKKMGTPLPPARRAVTLANDTLAWLACIRMTRTETHLKAEEVLPNIGIRCLLFVGEADLCFPEVRMCASQMLNATFFSLPGLDHGQASNRIDLTLPHIKKFLAEVNTVKAQKKDRESR